MSNPWPPPSVAPRPGGRPDRLAVASVVVSSLWLFWVGTVAGLVLAGVSRLRHRHDEVVWANRRWTNAAFVLCAVGLVTGIPAAAAVVHRIEVHDEDDVAKRNLLTLARGYPAASYPVGSRADWRIDGVSVVAATTPSQHPDVVSAEPWDIAAGRGRVLFAAVLSDAGTCYLAEITGTVAAVSPATFTSSPMLQTTARDTAAPGGGATDSRSFEGSTCTAATAHESLATTPPGP